MRKASFLVCRRIIAAMFVTVTACRTHTSELSAAICTDPIGYRSDVDVALQSLREDYAYANDKAVDWPRAESLARESARTAQSKRDLVGLLERLLDNLYDAHAIVRANTSHSPRIVPSGIDLWAEWIDGDAIVTAVRPGYGAEQQGVRPGMHVVAINGVPIKDAADSRLGPAVNSPAPAEARAWALVSALAGRHDSPRVLRVRDAGGTKDISLDSDTPFLIDRSMNEPPVEARQIDASSASAYGYVRLNALDDLRTVTAFDSTLEMLRGTPGLILDLRNTPGGGNTSVAEPILGRFIRQRQGYQRVVPRHGRAYTRMAEPRGPWTYTGPLVVLVGRWTGSMGEGMAIGLDGMHRGVVVGTPMAGLAGAVDDIKLPCSGLVIALPTARLLHMDGTPRERWIPPVRIDLIDSEREPANAQPAPSRPRLDQSRDPVLRHGMEILVGSSQWLY
jgi:C-terminal processing protease CtpA/Prc